MFMGILKIGREISRISFVEAATSSVAVSATVNEWLSFSVSTNTVTIKLAVAPTEEKYRVVITG
jgi:hypothetical protein